MDNNKKILKDWQEQIAVLPKVKFDQAQELYKKFLSETDEKKKRELRETIICGTLYNISKFIEHYAFFLLNDSEFDMNDIINSCNEAWISMIDEGKLLKAESFSQIFHLSHFFDEMSFNLLNNGEAIELPIRKSTLKDHYSCYLEAFDQTVEEYSEDSHGDFMSSFESNFREAIMNKGLSLKLMDDKSTITTEELMERILSFLEANDIQMSATILEKLKYILFHHIYKTYLLNINHVITYGMEENIITSIDYAEIRRIIFEEMHFYHKETKEMLAKMFGFDGECLSDKELCEVFNRSKSVISNKKFHAMMDVRREVSRIRSKKNFTESYTKY